MSDTLAGDEALRGLAERVCTAAGTTLAAVLFDLRDGTADAPAPAAIRAGWDSLDLHPEGDA